MPSDFSIHFLNAYDRILAVTILSQKSIRSIKYAVSAFQFTHTAGPCLPQMLHSIKIQQKNPYYFQEDTF